MHDIKDRLTRLEDSVTRLPSKEFIVLVAAATLLVAGGWAAMAPRLQSSREPDPRRKPTQPPSP